MRPGVTAFSFTSFDGSFRMNTPPGSYKVSSSRPPSVTQWARGKSSAETADPIVVIAGQTTDAQ